MRTREAAAFVYQIPGSYVQLSGLTVDMSKAVSRVLSRHFADFSIHDWTALASLFYEVFAKRLVRYEGCGRTEACLRDFRPALWDDPGSGRYYWRRNQLAFVPHGFYTLESRRSIVAMIDALADVVIRRLRTLSSAPPRDKARLKAELAIGMRGALSPAVLHSVRCESCPARDAKRRREIWN